MMNLDALSALTRDELSISEIMKAKLLQAACSSAVSFLVGATLPLMIAVILLPSSAIWATPLFSTVALALLGAISAEMSGIKLARPTLWIIVWGTFLMALMAPSGYYFG